MLLYNVICFPLLTNNKLWTFETDIDITKIRDICSRWYKAIALWKLFQLYYRLLLVTNIALNYLLSTFGYCFRITVLVINNFVKPDFSRTERRICNDLEVFLEVKFLVGNNLSRRQNIKKVTGLYFWRWLRYS